MIKVKGTGGGVNLKLANAAPEHVLEGMKFFSNGSNDVQVGTLLVADIFAYSFTGTNTDIGDGLDRVITLTSSGIFTARMDCDVIVTLQGGGGSGGKCYYTVPEVKATPNGFVSSGRGGHGYVTIATVSLVAGTDYTITLGAGANAPNHPYSIGGFSGGATTGFGLTANGGSGGRLPAPSAGIYVGADGAGGTENLIVANGGSAGSQYHDKVQDAVGPIHPGAGRIGAVRIRFS